MVILSGLFPSLGVRSNETKSNLIVFLQSMSEVNKKYKILFINTVYGNLVGIRE